VHLQGHRSVRDDYKDYDDDYYEDDDYYDDEEDVDDYMLTDISLTTIQGMSFGRSLGTSSHQYRQNVTSVDTINMSYEELLSLEERNGKVTLGLDASLLPLLPCYPFEEVEHIIEVEDRLCMICQMDFERGESLRHLFCNHFYHEACIDKWFKSHCTCPACKLDMRFVCQ